jgi:hypothetical protein
MDFKHIWDERVRQMNIRLSEPLKWFPLPILIPVCLVMLLTAHIISGSNPRAGHPANILSLPTDAGMDSSIWLSVSPLNDEILVTTADRKIFRWSQLHPQNKDIDPLVKYLKQNIHEEIKSAALTKRALKGQTLAIIAADQRLTFLHIRPIISALAQSGISRYAFETLNPAPSMR